MISEQDLHRFHEGTHPRVFDIFGAHAAELDGTAGTNFAVWAPNAKHVSVIGDFNGWQKDATVLSALDGTGIWQGFVGGVRKGAIYNYHVESHYGGYKADKADPFAFKTEVPPATASVVWDLDYQWHDADWLTRRRNVHRLDSPMSVYEVHLGSWRRVSGEGNRSLSYCELANELVRYVKAMGFTHVEFLPVMEHPFFGSWGYQTTGYFAPTSRLGTPQDLMYLIDQFHQNDIGVILDWVPSHFPGDEHGLAYFDGTHLYEHEDRRLGFHPDWNSYIFNYGRSEVRSFLLSSANFWLEKYHADALRVDAVASMLYRDYSRREGEWIPNEFGGRENLQAIGFLRQLNETIYREHPDVQTIAEESTAWPMVSKPTYLGGLGFGFKWDMGWMHDTLKYLSQDPLFRKFHHHELTFRMVYAFSENFMLPLSHDEVVYGKGSLLGKMPGDVWKKFANLRLLYSYMFTLPGKKLLFMGAEFGQWAEWNHDGELDWGVLDHPLHAQLRLLTGELNALYRSERALHGCDHSPGGFSWVDCHDGESNVISYLRKSESEAGTILVVCNFSPVPRPNYRVGVPHGGHWREIFNSDAKDFGGTGFGNFGGLNTVPIPLHGRLHSLTMNLPPLGAVALRWE